MITARSDITILARFAPVGRRRYRVVLVEKGSPGGLGGPGVGAATRAVARPMRMVGGHGLAESFVTYLASHSSLGDIRRAFAWYFPNVDVVQRPKHLPRTSHVWCRRKNNTSSQRIQAV